MTVVSKHNFGRSIDFRFRPQADDRDVEAFDLVSARLFLTEPTAAEKLAAGGSELDEQTDWTATDIGEYSIIFDAQTDATPESLKKYEKYFVVVNYKYETGGATVYDEEVIFLWRADSLTSWIRVSADDIYSLEFRIKDCGKSRAWVEDQIKLAIEDIIARLRSEGFDKHRLFNLEDYEPAAKRWATSYACFGLASEGNPHWTEKGKRWKEYAEAMYKSVAVGYDLDDDDKPEPSEKRAVGGGVAVLR